MDSGKSIQENKRYSMMDRSGKLRKLSFFCAAGVLCAVMIGAVSYKLFSRNGDKRPPPDIRVVLPELHHGDIILRSGVGLWSKWFREYSEKDQRFSHVGIVMIDNGKIRVLHAEGDDISGKGTVRLDSLETFINASTAVGISRFHTLDAARIADAAKKFHGRPFDWKFDLKDDRALYCTELIERAIRQVSPDIGLAKPDKIIPVDSCLDKKLFTEVPLPSANR